MMFRWVKCCALSCVMGLMECSKSEAKNIQQISTGFQVCEYVCTKLLNILLHFLNSLTFLEGVKAEGKRQTQVTAQKAQKLLRRGVMPSHQG